MATTRVQRIMTQPINLIFRFLQSKARIQIWLFEQKDLRIEGRIIQYLPDVVAQSNGKVVSHLGIPWSLVCMVLWTYLYVTSSTCHNLFSDICCCT
ncbi:hypothetical protein AMTR_s00019p00189060 [Amborella trichopoda]|uniref:Uncharacterized protein n=1 Tax=Amborella trichopoda TaxID=13333 RepID=W1PI05_AMBTC|nr:hypothetical protein AMTR_s00019p00189060 [Amborella trichopoda]